MTIDDEAGGCKSGHFCDDVISERSLIDCLLVVGKSLQVDRGNWMSLVCHWRVTGLSLVCRWFITGLSLVCR